MGLDIVELIMSIEEEFEIEIPDPVAESLTTPRTVIDYIASLPKFSDPQRPREYIADKVWLIIEDVIGIDRRDFDEDSRFIEDTAMD